jgi:hypothetical protein
MMSVSRSAFIRLSLLGLAASLTGCVTESEEAAFHPDPGGEENPVAVGQVVSSLRTVDGATIRFINEAGPGEPDSIAMEIFSSTKTPVTDELLAQDPTALEMFQAMAPGREAPAELSADHGRMRASAPRQLTATAFGVESFGAYNCDNAAGWQTDFLGWAPATLPNLFMLQNQSVVGTVYVAYAPRAYFDVCRPSDVSGASAAYTTRVQRRASPASAWATINTALNVLALENTRWRYHHTTANFCSSFQYKLTVTPTGGNRYHIGARYSADQSCNIEG